MNANNFVYVGYEGRLFVASKASWNENKAHVPDTNEASQEALAFLKTLSPKFELCGECCFTLAGSAKAGAKLLKEAGVQKVDFGQLA